MDQGRTFIRHGSGSGLVPALGTAGTSEGIALAEAVGLAEDMAVDMAEAVVEGMAEDIANQVRPRCASVVSLSSHLTHPVPAPAPILPRFYRYSIEVHPICADDRNERKILI